MTADRRDERPEDADPVAQSEARPASGSNHDPRQDDRPDGRTHDHRRAGRAAPGGRAGDVLRHDRGDGDRRDVPGAAEGDASDERPHRPPAQPVELARRQVEGRGRDGGGHRRMIGERRRAPGLRPGRGSGPRRPAARLPPGDAAGPPSGSAAATSTNRQSAFASRIWLGRPGPDAEQVRRCHDDGHAAGARRRHVEPIAAVQEVHPARRELGARGRQRVDADGRLLALELVDGADACLGRQQPPDGADLGVVRRDDEHVLPAEDPSDRRPRRSRSCRRRRARPRGERPPRPPRDSRCRRPTNRPASTEGRRPSSPTSGVVSRWCTRCASASSRSS